jgi:hypothetical protein
VLRLHLRVELQLTSPTLTRSPPLPLDLRSLLTFLPPSPLSRATGSLPTQPWLRFLKTDFGTLPRRLKDSDLTFPAIGSGEAPLKNASARPLFAPGLDRSYAHEKFPDTRPYDLYTKLYSETVCGRQLCSKKISAVGGYQVRKSGMKEKRELRERRRGGGTHSLTAHFPS